MAPAQVRLSLRQFVADNACTSSNDLGAVLSTLALREHSKFKAPLQGRRIECSIIPCNCSILPRTQSCSQATLRSHPVSPQCSLVAQVCDTQQCMWCAATLEYSPGSAVAIFVTYLQPHLLQRMHETEGAYNLCELTEVQLQIGLGLKDYRCCPALYSIDQSIKDSRWGQLAHLTNLQSFVRKRNRQRVTQTHVLPCPM
jgi:hypothetical protein